MFLYENIIIFYIRSPYPSGAFVGGWFRVPEGNEAQKAARKERNFTGQKRSLPEIFLGYQTQGVSPVGLTWAEKDALTI